MSRSFSFQLAETWNESRFACEKDVLRRRHWKGCCYFGLSDNKADSSSSARLGGGASWSLYSSSALIMEATTTEVIASTLHAFQLTFQNNSERELLLLFLQVWKLRFREYQELNQGHSAHKWWFSSLFSFYHRSHFLTEIFYLLIDPYHIKDIFMILEQGRLLSVKI